MIAFAADITRDMRIGTLEITGVLLLVAIFAGRPRIRTAADVGVVTPIGIDLDIFERGARRAVQLHTPFELGRSSDAAVVLRDPEVSRRHARFEGQNDVVYVEDLKSRNGTFLNGRRIGEAIEVRKGDEIDVGTTRLVVTAVRPV